MPHVPDDQIPPKHGKQCPYCEGRGKCINGRDGKPFTCPACGGCGVVPAPPSTEEVYIDNTKPHGVCTSHNTGGVEGLHPTWEAVKEAMDKFRQQEHQWNKRMAKALMDAGFALIGCPHLERHHLCVSEDLARAAQEVIQERKREQLERLKEVFKPKRE